MEILIMGVFAVVCSGIAGAKGRGQFRWGAFGLLTGPVAFIILAIMPSRKPVVIVKEE